jgi:hypothetical protein
MMKKDRYIIFFATFFTCLAYAAWADLLLNNTISSDPLGDIMNRINDVACIFLTLVTYSASGISAIVIIYAGLKYMTSQDAEQTTDAKNMIIYAIACLALILLACPIVDYLIIGTKIVPFQEKCNCFGSGNGSPDNSTMPPVQLCIDGTPAGQCSTTPGYAGYKCILSGSSLVLALDSSCSNPPDPSGSATTSTTTTTTSSTTTTTLADHEWCYNAETGGICSGLNVLRPGYQQDCCTEWKCCCQPASGTCTAP